MQCTGGSAFGLHFQNRNFLSKKILSSIGRPFIHIFRHDGRRSDRVNRRNIGKCVRDMRSSGVAIHRFHLFAHFKLSFKIENWDIYYVMFPHYSVFGHLFQSLFYSKRKKIPLLKGFFEKNICFVSILCPKPGNFLTWKIFSACFCQYREEIIILCMRILVTVLSGSPATWTK